MEINHLFKNIEEAWDYILCEEQGKLINNGWGKAPVTFRMPDFRAPMTDEMAKELYIPTDSLEHPANAFYNNADTDKFIMCHLQSGRFSLKPNLRSRKFLFRGQDCFYNDKKCTPNLFRPKGGVVNMNEPDRFIEEAMRGQELMLLMLSHPLVQLLDQGIELNGRNIQFEMNLYGLTQHYYNKTRFLDLTSSPDFASFFATCGYDPNTCTYFPKDSGDGVIYYYEINPEFDFKIGNITPWATSTIGLQVFPRSGNQYGFLCNMDENVDFNTIHPVTIVHFKHNINISQKYYDLFEGGKKLFPDDILTNHWNKYNAHDKTISERTIQMNHMFNQNRTLEYLKERIKSKGYTIKDYKVQFTPEELETYYQDVRNGFWREWCNKIHIPGDKTGQMKKDLLSAENNPNYEWAFKPNIPHTIDYTKGYLLSQYMSFIE